MKIIFKILVFVAIMFSFQSVDAQNKYAILVSAGQANADSTIMNSEYWYDLVIAYDDLIKQGYTQDNIFVFYGDGNDFKSKADYYKPKNHGWGSSIVDFDNSEISLLLAFSYIAGIVTDKDDIIIRWIVGHGGNIETKDDYIAYIANEYLELSESDIHELINKISHFKSRTIIWMTCHSGCIVEGDIKFDDNKTIVMTAADWNESSYSITKNGLPHTEFNYYIQSAIRGKDSEDNQINNADINRDAKISYGELFEYLRLLSPMRSNVQMSDHGNNANTYFVK